MGTTCWRDKFYTQKHEVDIRVDKIQSNNKKAANSIEGIMENKYCSLICCCCTANEMSNDYQLLEDNERLLSESEEHIEKLRIILEEDKLDKESTKEIIDKKVREIEQLYIEIQKLKVEDIQIHTSIKQN